MSRVAVIVGAGANELVVAHRLARAGWRAIVLDDGKRAAEAGWVLPAILRALELERHGFAFERRDPWLTAVLPHGGRLELWCDSERSAQAIRRLSERDAQRWPQFCESMARLAGLLQAIYSAPAPDPVARGLAGLAPLARLAMRARAHGGQAVHDLLRVLPMSIADLLNEWFESEPLKGALATAGIMRLHQGPRSGGTAFAMLHRHAGHAPGVFRPAASNLQTILERLPGIELRRGATVSEIAVRDTRAVGVVLANGEELAASTVICGMHAGTVFRELVDPGWLDPEFVRAVKNIRSRGVVAKVSIALGRALQGSRLAVAPSLEYLERAYDAVKYGEPSAQPYFEVQSEADQLHIDAQYVPYQPAGGAWNAERRRALGMRVVDTVAAVLPEVRAAIAGEPRVLVPPDLEQAYGWPQGQADHAELALDQILWMRPLPGWSRYRTPIDGLYLCGAGTHPGGALPGASGYHCTDQVLRDARSGVSG